MLRMSMRASHSAFEKRRNGSDWLTRTLKRPLGLEPIARSGSPLQKPCSCGILRRPAWRSAGWSPRLTSADREFSRSPLESTARRAPSTCQTMHPRRRRDRVFERASHITRHFVHHCGAPAARIDVAGSRHVIVTARRLVHVPPPRRRSQSADFRLVDRTREVTR